MKIREYRPEDLDMLKRYHEASGYEFDFPDMDSSTIELAEEIEDSNGNPMGIGVARRSLELFLVVNPNEHRVVRINAIGALHASMTPQLKAKGYSEANGYIPPSQKLWINTLCKRFGWVPNLPTYTIRG